MESNVKVSAEIRNEWKKSNASLEASYVASTDSKPVIIGDGDFEIAMISRKDGSGSFPNVKFRLKGDATQYSFNTRGGKTPNEDLPVKVAKFVASKDHLCTNGTVLKAGTIKWFAFQ